MRLTKTFLCSNLHFLRVKIVESRHHRNILTCTPINCIDDFCKDTDDVVEEEVVLERPLPLDSIANEAERLLIFWPIILQQDEQVPAALVIRSSCCPKGFRLQHIDACVARESHKVLWRGEVSRKDTQMNYCTSLTCKQATSRSTQRGNTCRS